MNYTLWGKARGAYLEIKARAEPNGPEALAGAEEEQNLKGPGSQNGTKKERDQMVPEA